MNCCPPNASDGFKEAKREEIDLKMRRGRFDRDTERIKALASAIDALGSTGAHGTASAEALAIRQLEAILSKQPDSTP